MRRDALAFLDYVRAACDKAGVQLRLEARYYTRAGDSGWFDDEKKILLVCVNDADWLTILAHEFSHLSQWTEKSPLYKEESEDQEDFEAWLAGTKRISKPKLIHVVRNIQRCELDAERRTVRLIKQFHLTTDIKKYIQVANFYIWQYEAARKFGRWVELHDDLSAKMPTTLMPKSQIGKLPVDFGMLS
jgi:hypothetical protein